MAHSQIQRPRLYHDLAYLWPLADPPEDYVFEASYWRDALRDKLGKGHHQILELGVGGGHLLSHLVPEFRATAVDISKQMLENARRLNPGVEHLEGDMRTVRLGKKFLAVLAHDAISYMLTENDLKAAFVTAREHLNPGGIFITVPDWFRETFRHTSVSHSTINRKDLEITFIKYVCDPDPTDSTIETHFFFLISEHGKIRMEHDRHVTGLFSIVDWQDWVSDAGFDVELVDYPVYEDEGPGWLLVCTAR